MSKSRSQQALNTNAAPRKENISTPNALLPAQSRKTVLGSTVGVLGGNKSHRPAGVIAQQNSGIVKASGAHQKTITGAATKPGRDPKL